MSDLIHDTTEEAQHSSRSLGYLFVAMAFIMSAVCLCFVLIAQVQNYTAADLWRVLVGG